MKPMFEWTDDEIRDYYDINPELSILTYAGMLGLSGGELKDILQTDGSACLLYTSPSPRDRTRSRMPSSA